MQTLKLTKKYEKYPEYKDSGIEWIGKIPSEWSTAPLRSVASENQLKNSDGLCQNLLSLSYGKIIEKDINTNEGLLPESFNTYQVVSKGNIVFRLTDLQNDKRSLRVGHVNLDEPGIITSAYLALNIQNKLNDRYAYYLLHAYDLQKVFYGMGGGVRQTLDFDNFKYLPVIIPSIKTQEKIVSYLNEKTSYIDQIIEKKQKLIGLLREKRTSVINNAVTKGLNQKVEFVESGVDWIGEMPKKWEMMPLGKILKYIQPGPYISETIQETLVNGMIPVLTAGKGFVLGYTEDNFGIFSEGLPVIIFDDFTTGKQFVNFSFKVRSSALKILINRDHNSSDIRYIYKCMEVLDFQTLEHNRHWIGMYRHESVPFPDLSEQKAIADFLEEKDKIFGRSIGNIERSIELLQEFKSSLISNVVTGKIKV